MATIYQVSELAGVSLATVSRVINGSTKVSTKTLQKVNAAMAELNYRPNSMARSLASNCSNSIGILVSELHGPFYGAMMGAIEKQLRLSGKHVIITAGHSDDASEKEGIEFLVSRNCDALIMHVEAVSDEYLIEIKEKIPPFVLINRHIEKLADNCISLDNALGGYIATKALLDHGHRNIAYISGPLWKTDARDRYKGHQKALAEYHVEYDPELLYEGDFQQFSGGAGIVALLGKGAKFSAVACANDETAAGAMRAIREHGLAIPEDISIVGFDNTTYAHYLYPKLCTVNYPIHDMGKMAASWVLKNVYKSNDDDTVKVFEPKVVWRDSVASLA